MRINEDIEVKWNLAIDIYERGKRKPHYESRTHNIVVNTGRQMICENITAQSFGPGTFVRHQDTVVRYIGFGIGGARQNSPSAAASPYSDLYPAGYEYAPAGTHNTQLDTDVAVARLERPVQVTAAPLWMQQISTPGTFPTAQSTRFIAVFGQTDISFGGYTSVPLSEIGLFISSADPSLPNGAAGPYPGAGTHLMAYDTFDTLHKTGGFSIEVRWELRL
jgi:hypothetical protein